MNRIFRTETLSAFSLSIFVALVSASVLVGCSDDPPRAEMALDAGMNIDGQVQLDAEVQNQCAEDNECITPNGASCVDASTLRTYLSPGMCANGVCEYAFVDMQCAAGCAEERCTPLADPVAYIKASNANTEDNFGVSIAHAGKHLAIGAYAEGSCVGGVNVDQNNNACSRVGAVYVFVLGDDGIWLQEAYLKAHNANTNAFFGSTLSFDGRRLAVGAVGEESCEDGVDATGDNTDCLSTGAVYVFDRSVDGIWTQEAYLKASVSRPVNYFGGAISLQGDLLAVGATGESGCATGINGDALDLGCHQSGAAYLFVRESSGSWREEAYLKASNAGADDLFGHAVSVDGNTVAVGAFWEDSCSTNAPHINDCVNSGAVYVFKRGANGWRQSAMIKHDDPRASDGFGRTLALVGDELAVGAPHESSCATGVDSRRVDDSCANAGAAYLYSQQGDESWRKDVYFKASNTEANDWFASSLAFAGDSLILGARFEDGCASGLNAEDDGSNACENAGAAYLFARTNGVWTQRRYMKSTHPDRGDNFAYALALDNQLLAIGASSESSCATGIDGEQDDNGCAKSGAAYIYSLAPLIEIE